MPRHTQVGPTALDKSALHPTYNPLPSAETQPDKKMGGETHTQSSQMMEKPATCFYFHPIKDRALCFPHKQLRFFCLQIVQHHELQNDSVFKEANAERAHNGRICHLVTMVGRISMRWHSLTMTHMRWGSLILPAALLHITLEMQSASIAGNSGSTSKWHLSPRPRHLPPQGPLVSHQLHAVS